MPADYFGAAKTLIGGVGDFLGSQSKTQGAELASQTYAQAAQLTKTSTAIKEAMLSRDIYKTLGGMRASASASGLAVSGSAQDLIQDSARQGAIAKALVGIQGRIDFEAFKAKSQAASQEASASSTGGFLGGIGSVIGIAGSLFSDDELKEDISLVRRREDGIGVYRFRYTGSAQFFEGAMANDVEKLRPEAIFYDEGLGFRMVDYGAIGMELKKVS